MDKFSLQSLCSDNNWSDCLQVTRQRWYQKNSSIKAINSILSQFPIAKSSAQPSIIVALPEPLLCDAAGLTHVFVGGKLGLCRGFLLQCSLFFSYSPQAFVSDYSKISHVVGLLEDWTLQWAECPYSFGLVTSPNEYAIYWVLLIMKNLQNTWGQF